MTSEVLTLAEAAERPEDNPLWDLMVKYCDNSNVDPELERRAAVLNDWIVSQPPPATKPLRPLVERWKHQRKRQQAVKRATPTWADKWQIERLYLKAQARTQRTGIPHVVDHIVPLQNALVCGLHVHTNMRVITYRANAKKSNRWSPRWDNV